MVQKTNMQKKCTKKQRNKQKKNKKRKKNFSIYIYCKVLIDLIYCIYRIYGFAPKLIYIRILNDSHDDNQAHFLLLSMHTTLYKTYDYILLFPKILQGIVSPF